MDNWRDRFWDWMGSGFGKKAEQMREQRKHARSGITKTPLYMRKAKNRKQNAVARKARKITRNRC